jgi:hypothetical protein
MSLMHYTYNTSSHSFTHTHIHTFTQLYHLEVALLNIYMYMYIYFPVATEKALYKSFISFFLFPCYITVLSYKRFFNISVINDFLYFSNNEKVGRIQHLNWITVREIKKCKTQSNNNRYKLLYSNSSCGVFK